MQISTRVHRFNNGQEMFKANHHSGRPKSTHTVWVGTSDRQPITATREKTSTRVQYAMSFDVSGPVYQIPTQLIGRVNGK
jgi:hypothetical protein